MEADILLWIQNNIRNDVLTPIFKFVTTLGNAGMIWIVLSVGLLIPKKTRRVGVLALVSLSFSALIDNVILKNVVARTRPYDVIEGLTSLVGSQKDYSFPSGHTGSDVPGTAEEAWNSDFSFCVSDGIIPVVCRCALSIGCTGRSPDWYWRRTAYSLVRYRLDRTKGIKRKKE